MSELTNDIMDLNEVDKFLLLLLGAKDAEPVPDETHIQKEMYFMQNIFPKLAEELDYEPYLYGPESEIVSKRVEELEYSNLLKKDGKKIELTTHGKKIFEKLSDTVDKDVIQKITRFKEFLNDLTVYELLAFTYFTYESQEDLKKESDIYDELSSKRVKLAISMYKKDKISAQKAAQIAGKDLMGFLKELKV